MKNKYIIKYLFDGFGRAEIEAESEEEAKEKFYYRDYIDDEQWGEHYCIDIIEEIEYKGDKEKEDALEEANKSLLG